MDKTRKINTGTIDEIISKKILLNIDYLKDGKYQISIMMGNKIIKEVSFCKTTIKKQKT